MFILLSTGTCPGAFSQAQEIQQLLLNIEKLSQLKDILSEMKEGYKVIRFGYNTVRDLSKGNFRLHKTFLDGLLAVSPAVREYKKVGDLIHYQLLLVREYKTAYGRFRKDGNFSVQELGYLEKVYGNLFDQSLKDLDDLTTVITADKLRMTDDERLRAIDNLCDKMQDKLLFLRHFNSSTAILAIQRAKGKNDVATIREIYGLTY